MNKENYYYQEIGQLLSRHRIIIIIKNKNNYFKTVNTTFKGRTTSQKISNLDLNEARLFMDNEKINIALNIFYIVI